LKFGKGGEWPRHINADLGVPGDKPTAALLGLWVVY
jgi:hypothetical protein